MTQEEKDLLLKDLCSRLPYGVKVEITWWDLGQGFSIDTTLEPDHITQLLNDTEGEIEIKPYLRKMSDMTEEEEQEFQEINLFELPFTVEGLDWLNAHHFDYRGLIDDGLAIKVTDENNPYKNE